MSLGTKSAYEKWGKRTFDLFWVLLGLLILGLPILVLALVGQIVQGKPVLFRQERIGRDGRPFTLLKFRTMVVRGESDSPVTFSGDLRITAWGRFLRGLKLDEFPQLVNVLRGDMSLVGPRPDVPGYWDELPAEDRHLLELRPGVTGPATVLFRNEEELLSSAEDPEAFSDHVLFPRKVEAARRYAREVSLIQDLKWILYTFLPAPWLATRLTKEGWMDEVGILH